MNRRDARWMAIALEAARRGQPAPNPSVGAVVVAGGRAVAVGWHARAGGLHAEAHALRMAGQRGRGAVLYVTLEPCNHHGRTPPCVDAVLAAGVARVVVACRDPNPHVRGRGIERLRRAGIAVTVGVLRSPATALIADWADTLGASPSSSFSFEAIAAREATEQQLLRAPPQERT